MRLLRSLLLLAAVLLSVTSAKRTRFCPTGNIPNKVVKALFAKCLFIPDDVIFQRSAFLPARHIGDGDFSADRVKYAAGSITINNSPLKFISFERLTTVNGNLVITQNEELSDFDAPELTTVNGNLTFSFNSDMRKFEVLKLTVVMGNLIVTNNPLLYWYVLSPTPLNIHGFYRFCNNFNSSPSSSLNIKTDDFTVIGRHAGRNHCQTAGVCGNSTAVNLC
jgi:hypothetical protein